MALFSQHLAGMYLDLNTKSNRVSRKCFEGRQIILGRSGRTSSAAIGHRNIIFIYIWPDRS
jgi:hypothetical protein